MTASGGVEGYIAQVLQHRRNHDTFELLAISVDEHPNLQQRIDAPRGCRQLAQELGPWLS